MMARLMLKSKLYSTYGSEIDRAAEAEQSDGEMLGREVGQLYDHEAV